MINKEFIHVIHLFKCDRLTDQEKFFLSQLFQLKRFKAEFIEILDSNEDKAEYNKLNNDERFFLIGNERVAKLEPKQAKKINQLIASSQFAASNTNSPQSNNAQCSHYHQYATKKEYFKK